MTATAQREGARWINRRPEPDEFADWFGANVPLHDERLDLSKYIGGIVLIPAEEKIKVPEIAANGRLLITEEVRMVYVPYPQVETRINYFWDLMALRKDDWRAVIDPVEVPGKYEGDGAIAQINRTLPPGFFILPVPVKDGYTNYLVSSVEISIYERSVTWHRHDDGELLPSEPPIMTGRGTKQVALTKSTFKGDRVWADDNAIMKAETGAKGRAMGFLGMLAVPGAGVATAEDMIEALSAERAGAVEPAPEPQLPSTPGTKKPAAAAPIEAAAPEVKTEEQVVEEERQAMLARARELINTLTEAYPEKMAEFREWATSRKPPVRNIGALQGGALKGTVKRLEKLLEDANQAALIEDDERGGEAGEILRAGPGDPATKDTAATPTPEADGDAEPS